jgi:hypothetical protein
VFKLRRELYRQISSDGVRRTVSIAKPRQRTEYSAAR